jgi:hypothetical protein
MRLASLLAGLALVGSPAQEPARAPAPQGLTARQTRLIEGLRRAAPGSTPDPAFVADAREDLAALFAILCAGSLPPVQGERAGVEDGEARRLEPVQEQWILCSARAAGRSSVLPLARTLLAAHREVPARAASIRLIGAVGNARDLDDLLARDGGAAGGELDRLIGDALSQAAGEILARDEHAFTYVSARWRSLSEPVLEPLVRATRAARGAGALEFLAEVIQWRADHAGLALAMVQEIGRSLDPAADAEVLRRIRPLLQPARGNLCRAAALALGALADHESIPELIELLGADGGLRANAHWALRRITGLSLPATRAAWERWHDRESSWIEQSGGEAFGRLRSRDPDEVCEAIRALSAHPLAREDLVLALVELLADEDAAVRTLACRAIPDLGDGRAIPGLLALLGDEDESVSAVAHEALRRVTGRELPPDAEAWRALLARP